MANSWIIKHPGGWESLFSFLRQMSLDKPVEVRWGPVRRSNQQNRYLFGVVYKTLALGLMEQGRGPVDVDSIHYICKEQFLPRVPVGTTGRTMPMSTTDLCRSGNEESFQDYVEQIKELAASAYSIYIPDPSEET